MASIYYLCSDAECVEAQLVARYENHEQRGRKEHFSAIIIQRSYKGYVVRKMVRNWHKAAIKIQKVVRGWLVRWHLPEILKSYLDHVAAKFYNEKATKIQALWKGYQVRKVINIKKILEERARIGEINNKMRLLLREEYRRNKRLIMVNGVEVENVWFEKCLRTLVDRHHLLRTIQREGVLSEHGSKKFSQLETLLKAIPCADYIHAIHKTYSYHNHKERIKSQWDEEGRLVQPHKFDLNTHVPPKPYERVFFYSD